VLSSFINLPSYYYKQSSICRETGVYAIYELIDDKWELFDYDFYLFYDNCELFDDNCDLFINDNYELINDDLDEICFLNN